MALRPLTAEELLDRCDLAGVARVVSVGRADPTAPNLARLEFVEIYKGSVRAPARFAHVRLHGGAGAAEGRLAPGGWSDWWDYPAGETVVTHLNWNDRDGVYETTWPGAVWEAQDAAA